MQAESKSLGLGLEYSAEMAKVANVAKYTKALGWVATGISVGVTEHQYQTGQISNTGRVIEDVSTGISAIPVVGTPWAIGWKLGKAYGPSKWFK